MGYLAVYGGFMVGVVLHKVERRLKIEPTGLLLLVYLVGVLFGVLIGG